MKIIGHRGAMGLAPENTLAALQKGLEHHADMLEFDIRVTSDHVPILHHDPHISDADGRQLQIKAHTFDELKEHKPDLATFEEALTAINTRSIGYIEVKDSEPTGPIIAVLKHFITRIYSSDQLLFASFSQSVLLELHKAFPDVPTMVLESWSGYRARKRANQLGTRLLCMNQRWLWWGFISPIARGGWKLSAYTVNDPKKAKRWAKWGLYGVVTDYPDLFD